MPNVRPRVKPQKLAYQVLRTRSHGQGQKTQESAQTYPTDNSYTDNSCCDDGWSYNEWNDDWSSVGGHEGREQT